MTEGWTKHTLPEVLEAVEKGITVAGTARVLGCDRKTVQNYARRWKAVAEALEAKRHELVDLSEMALRGAVLRGEPWAVAFALRTLGKDRGYSERHEVVNKAETLEVVTRIVHVDADHD